MASSTPITLTIDLRLVQRLLLGLCATLIGLNLLTIIFKYLLGYPYVLGFVAQFEFDKEHNIPTYCSAVLLLLAALLLFVVAKSYRAKGKDNVTHWIVLSILFLYLSIDEASAIHEMLIEPLRRSMSLGGAFYFSWVIVGILAVLILAACYARFIFRLPPLTRLQFIVAAGLYISGAIGVEMIGGYYASSFSMETIAYALITTLEESLELIGVSLFVFSLFQFLAKEQTCYQVRICTSTQIHNDDAQPNP